MPDLFPSPSHPRFPEPENAATLAHERYPRRPVASSFSLAPWAFALLPLVACRPVLELGGTDVDPIDSGAAQSCEAGACLPTGCTTGAACEGVCFVPDAARTRLVGGVEPIGALFVDGNGDRHPDVLVSNLTTADVRFHPGDGAGGWGTPQVLDVGRMQLGSAIADFTGDGVEDVFLRQPETRRARLIVGGPTGLSIGGDVTIASDSIALVPHDVDVDGDVDLLVARTDARCFDVLRNAGGASFPDPASACIPFPESRLWRWSARGVDLDGDGRMELVGIPYTSGRMVAFDLDLAGATFREVARWTLQSASGTVLVTNASGDAALELVAMAQDGISPPEVFPARIDGLEPLCLGAKPPAGVDVNGVADVDSDGLPDFLGFDSTRDASVVARSAPTPPFLQ